MEEKQRTLQQNAAMHLYFTQLAEALNDSGYDMRATLKESIEIPWTSQSIKEYLWRPIQKLQLGKESTTELTSQEIDKVYEVLNRAIGTKTGVHVPFPSEQELIFKQML